MCNTESPYYKQYISFTSTRHERLIDFGAFFKDFQPGLENFEKLKMFKELAPKTLTIITMNPLNVNWVHDNMLKC